MIAVEQKENYAVLLDSDNHEIEKIISDNPDVKYIINNVSKTLHVSDELINVIKIFKSNFIIYAIIFQDVNHIPILQIHTIDTSTFFHTVLRCAYIIGDVNGIKKDTITTLGKYIFATNQCFDCKYYSKDLNLRCAVNPSIILNPDFGCDDYELIANKRLPSRR